MLRRNSKSGSSRTRRSIKKRQPPRESAAQIIERLADELRVQNDHFRRAAAHIESTRAHFSGFDDRTAAAVVVLDSRGIIRSANAAANLMLGVDSSFLLNRPMSMFVAERDCEEFADHMLRCRDGLHVVSQIRIRYQNEDIPVQLTSRPSKAGKTVRYRTNVTDLRNREELARFVREARQSLRMLHSQLALAEESERRRIAVDIHDHIGQTLAVIKMKLGAVCSTLTDEPAAAVREVIDLVSRCVGQTRSLSFDLSPPMLYDLGLGPALQWLVEQKSSSDLRFQFSESGNSRPLPLDTRIFLFQATRELLTNTIKHSQATCGMVSLSRLDGHVTLTVKDDGRGFQRLVNSAGPTSGFGLFSIRERLRTLGGEMRVASLNGAQVSLIVPIHEDGGHRSKTWPQK